MRLKFKFLLVLLLIIPFVAYAQNYPTQRQIAKALKKEVENGRSKSIVVGIIDNGIEDYFAYGKPFNGKTEAANKNTIYEVASITKIFTTTLLADLIVKGQLSPDERLIEFLPDSVNLKDDQCKEITIEHLATHTSGLSF